MKSETLPPPQSPVPDAADAAFERRKSAVLDAYDRHDPIIRAYVRSKITHHADAQDVVQEFWKRVLMDAPSGKIEHLPWLMRKARYTVGDHFRKRKQLKREEPTGEIDSTIQDPAIGELDASPEADAEIRRQFFENFPDIDLNDRQREVLWLHGRHGLTLEEISERTGVAPSTIHDWIIKGRNEISKSLES